MPDDPTYLRRFADAEAASMYECSEYGAKSYASAIWREQRPLLRDLIRDVVEESQTVRTLDFACGTGRITELLLEIGLKPDALDISSEMIRLAKPKCADATFFSGNVLEDDELCPGPYDLVTAFRLLLNLDPGLRVPILKKIRARMATGGTFILNLHGNASSLRHPAIAWKRRRGIRSAEVMLNEMTVEEADECLKQAGFEITSKTGLGVLPPTFYRFPLQDAVVAMDRGLSSIAALQRFCIDQIFVCRTSK